MNTKLELVDLGLVFCFRKPIIIKMMFTLFRDVKFSHLIP
jgi:hypothetical protein